MSDRRSELRKKAGEAGITETGYYVEWLEKRIAELTADESPRQAAERIVEEFSDVSGTGFRWSEMADAITTAIQAASNAQLERGRAKIAELESERIRLSVELARAKQEMKARWKYAESLNHTVHVREFMGKFEQHIGEAPGFPPQEVLDLRVKLIAEEFAELLEAGRYGFTIHINRYSSEEDQMHFGTCSGLRYHKGPDFPAFIDALLDLEYVTLGTHVSCGVDPQLLWEAVHASNLAKQPAADKFSKIVKPDGWTPPNIAGALREQGWGGAE